LSDRAVAGASTEDIILGVFPGKEICGEFWPSGADSDPLPAVVLSTSADAPSCGSVAGPSSDLLGAVLREPAGVTGEAAAGAKPELQEEIASTLEVAIVLGCGDKDGRGDGMALGIGTKDG
jgi:hypothetical protein